MRVRITFRSEIYIEGDSLQDVRSQYESLPIYNDETVENNGLAYVEDVSVEDTETGEDLDNEWWAL